MKTFMRLYKECNRIDRYANITQQTEKGDL